MASSSLAKRLYDLSGTNIQVDVGDGSLGTTVEAIATPPSGKRLIVNKIVISPTSVGANGRVTISVYGSDDVLDYVLLTNLMWTVAFPLVLDLSSCPLELSTGQYLTAKTAADTQTVNITVTSFVVD